MNISGTTSTASMINYPGAGASAQAVGHAIDINIDNIASGRGDDDIPLGIAVSTRVMGMEQDVFESAAAQLINSMTAVMTGTGGNIDISV